nr:vegetative cell wall protein gp1-like [Penaeus vannamei]
MSVDCSSLSREDECGCKYLVGSSSRRFEVLSYEIPFPKRKEVQTVARDCEKLRESATNSDGAGACTKAARWDNERIKAVLGPKTRESQPPPKTPPAHPPSAHPPPKPSGPPPPKPSKALRQPPSKALRQPPPPKPSASPPLQTSTNPPPPKPFASPTPPKPSASPPPPKPPPAYPSKALHQPTHMPLPTTSIQWLWYDYGMFVDNPLFCFQSLF